MKKALQAGNGIALLLTIIISYLSNTGVFNGNTMATVSAKYQNLFTPAAYAFSIWGFIYLSLLSFVIYQGRGLFGKDPAADPALGKIGPWFIVSCLANCCWVLAWMYEYTGLSVVIMSLLLFSLVKIILRTNMEREDPLWRTIVFIWWPFCWYSGWITVALIANVAAYLTKIGWQGGPVSPVGWTVAMIVVAGAINLVITWTRNMREFAFVGVWALVAIAVANWERTPSVVLTALVVSVILFVSSGVHGYRNRKFSPFRKR